MTQRDHHAPLNQLWDEGGDGTELGGDGDHLDVFPRGEIGKAVDFFQILPRVGGAKDGEVVDPVLGGREEGAFDVCAEGFGAILGVADAVAGAVDFFVCCSGRGGGGGIGRGRDGTERTEVWKRGVVQLRRLGGQSGEIGSDAGADEFGVEGVDVFDVFRGGGERRKVEAEGAVELAVD